MGVRMRYTRLEETWARASLVQEMRAPGACISRNRCMHPSACLGMLLFLQFVLCVSLNRSSVCPVIGASPLLFICTEVQVCSRSKLSSAYIELGRLWSEATHLS